MTKELSLLDACKAYNAGKPVKVTARYLFQSDTKTGHAETIEQSTVIKKGNDYRTADNSFYTPINFADHLRVARHSYMIFYFSEQATENFMHTQYGSRHAQTATARRTTCHFKTAQLTRTPIDSPND